MAKKAKEVILDIGLTDVIYGVVFAYGFNFFDSAKSVSSYLFLGFAYAVLIIDWIYTHHTYWGKNYKRTYLILDLLVLFVFSRLLRTAVLNDAQFIYWFGALFIGYVLWDIVMRVDKIEHGFEWRMALAGDIGGAVLFFAAGILASLNIIHSDNIFTPIILIVIYLASLGTWFNKIGGKKGNT